MRRLPARHACNSHLQASRENRLNAQYMLQNGLDSFTSPNLVTIAPIPEVAIRLPADGSDLYVRASGHSARWNFGDCLSSAVAMDLDAPLLFKGRDFAHTDVRRAP